MKRQTDRQETKKSSKSFLRVKDGNDQESQKQNKNKKRRR